MIAPPIDLAQPECLLWCELPMRAIGHARPRVTARGTFTPRRTAQWRSAAALLLRQAAHGRAIDGPVVLSLLAEFRVARSARHPVGAPHCDRPDIDNIAKAVMDAMVQARVIEDDRMVWSIYASKVWAERDMLTCALYRGGDGDAFDRDTGAGGNSR